MSLPRMLSIAALLSLSVTVNAVPMNPFAIVTIGDSLSDTGNLSFLTATPPSPPYYGDTGPYSQVLPSSSFARFSDGPVWVEQLEQRLGGGAQWSAFVRDRFETVTGLTPDEFFGAPPGTVGTIESSIPSTWAGTNYSYGGAQTFGTLLGGLSLEDQTAQVESLLANGPFGGGGLTQAQLGSSLFVVQGGGNDLFAITSPADAPGVIATAVDNIAGYIETLALAGAEQFLVPNLPGYLIEDDWIAATSVGARLGAEAFNTLLEVELDNLRNNLGIDIFEVDFMGLFDDILADPLAFGLTNTTAPCLDLDATLATESLCGDSSQYMMFDGLHPGAVVHRAMGDLAFAALPDAGPMGVPEPGTLVLCLVALGGLVRLRR